MAGLKFCAPGDCAQSGEISAAEYVCRHLQLRGIILPMHFDVGANVEAYWTILRSIFGESSEIHAFEQLSAAFSKMVERPRARVVGHEMGLSRRNIKGTPFGVGFECSAQLLQKGNALL